MSDGGDSGHVRGSWHAFAGDDVWAELVHRGVTRGHRAGSVILRQGEPGTHVLAVLKGVAKVVRCEGDGDLTLLAFRGPGELLGEVAVLDDGERSATVETITRCTVAVVHRNDFLRLATERDLFPALVRYALMRLRESDQARSAGDAPARLAATLVRLAEISGHATGSSAMPLELALTRNELAQHLQISRNKVTATLNELAAQGVHAGRQRVLLQDLPALRRRAASVDC